MTKNNKKGFTIIEVVLVLAIAGLIFLMVFIALPALQRSQRNTRRRQDMARILSALNDYQSNNNGKMPETNGNLVAFVKRYVDDKCTSTVSDTATATSGTIPFTGCSDQFTDPDGTPYSLSHHTISATGYSPSVGTKNDYTGYGGTPETAITHVIHYFTTANCSDEEGKVQMARGKTEVSISYYLEGGAIYCGDNQ